MAVPVLLPHVRRCRSLQCSLIFPDSGDAPDTPIGLRSGREWTKVEGGLETGSDYWWRPGLLDTSEPEVTLTSPSDPNPWRIAALADGRRYLWRDNPDDPDDPDVMFWTETEEAGAMCWRSSEGDISFTDPFADATGMD